MARCHQWHNIPWQALVDCLEVLYYRNNRGPTHLRAKRCSTEEELRLQYKKICHFTSRMEATIADFAATERSKYDLGTILKREKVFDYEFLSDILTPEYQSLDFWRSRKEQPDRYGYSGGDEAGLIKELFNVNNMEAILLLVHTGVGIQDLEVRSIPIAGYGFFHLAEDCLQIYVFLNHLIASGDMESPHRWHSPWKRAVQHACCSRDLGYVQQRVLKSYLTGGIRVGWVNPDGIGGLLGFSDYRGMDDMLKYCFRILYQYKMVSEEIHGKSIPSLIPSPLLSLWQYLRFSSFECNIYIIGHSPLCTFGHCQLASQLSHIAGEAHQGQRERDCLYRLDRRKASDSEF